MIIINVLHEVDQAIHACYHLKMTLKKLTNTSNVKYYCDIDMKKKERKGRGKSWGQFRAIFQEKYSE